MAFRFNVINKNGREEPWTGIFKNEDACDHWYERYGKFHEERGHRMVKRKGPGYTYEEVELSDKDQKFKELVQLLSKE